MKEQTCRPLSKRERIRYEAYQVLCERMKEQGYQRVELTVDVVRANLWAGVVALPFLLIAAVAFFAKNPMGILHLSPSKMFLFLAEWVVLLILHELIHGLCWGLMAPRGFRAVSFGVIWQMLTPYCNCSDALKRWQYLLGGMMPTLILGFGLAGISVAVGSFWLFLLAELMILGGGGDLLICLKLLRYHPHTAKAIYYDHPCECGLVVFEPTAEHS